MSIDGANGQFCATEEDNELHFDLGWPEIPEDVYMASGGYDIIRCTSNQSSRISGFTPPPLPLQVHATLNYQPKEWTSRCQHKTNYVVDSNGNIFHVSHNECHLEGCNGEQCFIYEPQHDNLTRLETTLTPSTLTLVANKRRLNGFSEKLKNIRNNEGCPEGSTDCERTHSNVSHIFPAKRRRLPELNELETVFEMESSTELEQDDDAQLNVAKKRKEDLEDLKIIPTLYFVNSSWPSSLTSEQENEKSNSMEQPGCSTRCSNAEVEQMRSCNSNINCESPSDIEMD